MTSAIDLVMVFNTSPVPRIDIMLSNVLSLQPFFAYLTLLLLQFKNCAPLIWKRNGYTIRA